jgi:hypothetical protein
VIARDQCGECWFTNFATLEEAEKQYARYRKADGYVRVLLVDPKRDVILRDAPASD